MHYSQFLRALTLGIALGSLFASTLTATPAQAGASILVEADSGKVLRAENATYPWYPASVTKLMTMYVTLQAVKQGRITLDTLFTVSRNALAQAPTKMGFVVGVEQMTTTPGPEVGRNLLKASYIREEADIDGGFAGIFGKIAALYFQRWGDQSDALARIAAKNHKNGVGNPYAQIRKDFGYEFCRQESDKNPRVAGPLKRTDCSPVSDGAAALILTDVDTALKLNKAIVFRAAEHVQDFLPMSRRDILKFEGCAVAWKRALAQAGIALPDLSFAEVHDCFTIAELIEYEAMGLAPEGQGARVIAEGVVAKDGKLPINPSGGLKAKGHPIGATGVSMHAITSMQLTGTAGDMQIKDATLGGIFNMGGAAVANYVSILERLR